MYLLQSNAEMRSPAQILLPIVFAIIGAIVCYNRAKELNRNEGLWAFFGFAVPIVAVIWIFCLKPIIKWEDNPENKTTT